jgi:hypothetical protein
VQVIDEGVSHLALEIDVDDRQLWLVLVGQPVGVGGFARWPAHLHAFDLDERLQGVGNVPLILNDQDT